MRIGAAVALATTVVLMFAANANAAQIEVAAEVQKTTVDYNPPLGRAGNQETVTMVVRDRKRRAIGDLNLNCRWVTSGLRLCGGQMTLPLGQIVVLGASRTRYVGTMSVTGGSGRYRGARGTMRFVLVGTGMYVLSVNYVR